MWFDVKRKKQQQGFNDMNRASTQLSLLKSVTVDCKPVMVPPTPRVASWWICPSERNIQKNMGVALTLLCLQVKVMFVGSDSHS